MKRLEEVIKSKDGLRSMIKNITTITGLAGTSKTTKCKELIDQIVDIDKRCLYLSFNKYLKKSFDENNFNPYIKASTIHSLCFRVLEKYNKLPKAFMGTQEIDDNEQNDTLTEDNYIELIRTFNNLKVNEITIDDLKNVSIIVCDEYQNFSRDLIKVVQKLTCLGCFSLYLVGDPNQNIHGFVKNHRSGKSNFRFIENDFCRMPDKEIVQDENYRNPIAITKMINSFLRKTGISEIFYKIDNTMNKDDGYSKVPEIHYFNTMDEETNFVLGKIKNMTTDQIGKTMIIYRYKVNSILMDREMKKNDISVKRGTIHSSIGTDVENVFYMGFKE